MGNSDNSSLPHILLVEDHADTARVLCQLLEIDGYRVTLAERLEDAVRLCHGNSFDVMLVDLELPDGDGMNLLGRVREKCRAPGIVYSGYAGPELRERAKQLGYREYLVKPVPLQVLTAAIRRAIGSRPAETAI